MLWLVLALQCTPALVCAVSTHLFVGALRDDWADDAPGRPWRRAAPAAGLLALSATGFLVAVAPALATLLEILR